MRIGGQPLDPARTYQVCACEREGDPNDMLCRMKGVTEAHNTPNSLHSVMKDYLTAFSPVSPKLPHSARILDASQQLLTQVRGVDYQFT